ncbi:hypothetical protein B0I00_1244 [Novosphingobium kunmingense]|uniref:Uncharacterized protein n=1 Tax=Novosphingobium kunmingense TaxID=1211806 RepID=A0A2N0HJ85_9SPHN|nr:hypothetical protein [Novosphingobium kunmingense]PKB19017.1 hypothetical protein B0I00_1244 [Novosphingobium kunmingense]
MKRIILSSIAAIAAIGSATAAIANTAPPAEIPRAASTPTTPKNWVGPTGKILAQALVDQVAASHPELVSITVHAVPAGLTDYTMIAGTFPDRIGNVSSPGDVITAKKGVTQVESKWGTPDFGKKVSILVPLKDTSGKYLPVTMVLAFKQSPTSGLIDLDFMHPAVRIRDSLAPMIASTEALFAPVR